MIGLLLKLTGKKPTFELGKLVWTAGVNERIATDSEFAKFVTKSLGRYVTRDWGELGAEDKKANDWSLENGERLLASYEEGDEKIWIITEWNRSVTTILFPSEY